MLRELFRTIAPRVHRNTSHRRMSSCLRLHLVMVPHRSFAKASGKDTKGGSGKEKAKAAPVDPVEFDISDAEEKMSAALAHMKQVFGSLKVGRASPDYLNQVKVAVGSDSLLLTDVAQVNVRSATLLVVTVYDIDMLKNVEIAIKNSGLNLNPFTEKNAVHVPLPKPSKEMREDLIKQAKAKSEDCKATIRRIRQDALQKIKKLGASKDDGFRMGKEVQTLTDEHTDKVDALRKDKEKELTTV